MCKMDILKYYGFVVGAQNQIINIHNFVLQSPTSINHMSATQNIRETNQSLSDAVADNVAISTANSSSSTTGTTTTATALAPTATTATTMTSVISNRPMVTVTNTVVDTAQAQLVSSTVVAGNVDGAVTVSVNDIDDASATTTNTLTNNKNFDINSSTVADV